MPAFAPIIEKIREEESYSTKAAVLNILVDLFQGKKAKLTSEDKQELSDFAFGEVRHLIDLLPTVTSYKEKDAIFGYEDMLLTLVMLCHKSPAEIPEEHLASIRTLIDLVDRERFLENAIDGIFKEGRNDETAVRQLLSMVIPLKDEFQKGQIYQGLLHYQAETQRLPEASKQLFADYIASEIKRYLSSASDEAIANNLEFACDVARYFMNDTLISLLYDVLKLEKNNISYYAVASLLDAHRSVPQEIISALAHDLVHAELTYLLLKKHGLLSMFPEDLNAPEYLAKSNLVHWLIYPTELGKEPDRIEFLGKVKKKEVYYVFRFTSDSDNLGEDLKEKWLIGWSSEEGGTFSNFDLYEAFEQKTPEKTLKAIKKRLL